MIDTTGAKKEYEPEQHSGLTYEEACKKAYKWLSLKHTD